MPRIAEVLAGHHFAIAICVCRSPANRSWAALHPDAQRAPILPAMYGTEHIAPWLWPPGTHNQQVDRVRTEGGRRRPSGPYSMCAAVQTSGPVFLLQKPMNCTTAPHTPNAVTAMSPRRTHARGIRLVMLVALLTASSSPVFAQVRADDMPENANPNRYGSGWTCDRGYRKVDGICHVLKVPANAYSTDASYGRGWRCTWGYRETGESCLAVKPPANAHLSSSNGDTWKCDRGFRKSDDKCVVIKVPPNGYLSNASYGTGWECEAGYRAEAGNCVAIQVPANGYLSDASYGPGWKCMRGFRAAKNACIAIKIPANAFLSDASHGPGWICNRGYRATETACIALQVPENAHLDYSGNDWECNQPYLKRAGGCALR